MGAQRATRTGAVVVTGASSGIGRACALHLAALGFRVFASVRRAEDGAALRAASSARLTPVLLDVADETSIRAATETITAAAGAAGLAGLVNNAGIGVAGPLKFLPLAEFRTQLEVNVTGQLAVTQALLPLLRLGRGRIVNMGSIGGRIASPFVGPYSASKFALEALTDALRMELRSWGVHVAIVEPGTVATPIWEKSVARTDRLVQALPHQAQTLYGAAFAALRAVAERTGKEGLGVPPEVVARAVAHALTARRPKTRYLVGWDARIGVLFTLVPDRLRDCVMLRQAGLARGRGGAAPRQPHSALGLDGGPHQRGRV
jgi:NAD(P)-dependent dehydrogenase (short-subunit alcohol dehydrogenase family)